MEKTTINVFVGPSETAGYYQNLSRGLNELNHNVDFYNLYPNNYEYNFYEETSCFLSKSIKYLRGKSSRFFFLLINFLSFIFLIKIIFKYDVFVFSFLRSILNFNIDLWIFKILKKRVIMVACHGSEVRPFYLDGSHSENHIGKETYSLRIRILEIIKILKIRIVENNSTVISYQPIGQYFRKRYINSIDIGFPIPFIQSKKRIKPQNQIIHCPTNYDAKGSNVIKSVFDDLSKVYQEIEFKILSNRKNSEIIEEIEKSIIVVDQIYSDSLISGIKSECISLNKPVIVAGFEINKLKNINLENKKIFQGVVNTEDFRISLIKLIDSLKQKKNDSNLNYQWNKKSFFLNFQKIIENKFDNSWYVYPIENNFIFGYGLSKEKIIKNYNLILNKYPFFFKIIKSSKFKEEVIKLIHTS